MIYVVAVADLAVAVWLLWYARARERRDRAGMAVVGMMFVACAVALAAIAVTHQRKPPTRLPSPVPTSPGENIDQDPSARAPSAILA